MTEKFTAIVPLINDLDTHDFNALQKLVALVPFFMVLYLDESQARSLITSYRVRIACAALT